ncbi:DUF6526 family protein [Chryseolinea lacunae]|uniref:Uncharacterized protein n=1 Tax=Chryseolinea lacunae TaxID=2801331 RepID=A0ABS1KWI9_9BACT|nr:DUF6526 family protein [Chryseolinea lacunae]MBL0743838.1 hypothetical protein [Chryseolinea lacunae]
MKQQDYANHVRYYAPHHFVFYPVVLTCAGMCTYFMFHPPSEVVVWLALGGQFMLLSWLSFMMRQHYGLINQNRTVRLELRLRYYILTQQRFEAVEQQLTFNQIAALRFASDAEFVDLTQRALREKLSPDQIKQSIKQWLPDTMRV